MSPVGERELNERQGGQLSDLFSSAKFIEEGDRLFIKLLSFPKFVETFFGDREISFVRLAEPIDASDVRIDRMLATPFLQASNNSSNVLPVSLVMRFIKSFLTNGYKFSKRFVKSSRSDAIAFRKQSFNISSSPTTWAVMFLLKSLLTSGSDTSSTSLMNALW